MNIFYMNKKKSGKINKELQFDTTAVADLSFNLLIFFIVTASFMIRQGIFLSLPSADSVPMKVEAQQLAEVYPESDGFVFEGERKDRDDILKILRLRKESRSDLVAVIHMKPELKYDRLIDSLSLVRESGIVRVSVKDR